MSEIIFAPVRFGIDLDDCKAVDIWREALQQHLFKQFGWKCRSCGFDKTNVFDLHEGIVTRGDCQGWLFEYRGLVFHEFNCFNLCRDCHTNWGEVFPREKAWELSCKRYGEGIVREWYEGLPWKVGPPRQF